MIDQVNAADKPDVYDFEAEFYAHVGNYVSRNDVDFFVKEARSAGGTVLEIGCGTGRVLLPTARSGTRIVGLDYSQGMLQRCRQALSREPASVRSRVALVRADMRQFKFRRAFSLVTLPFRPFQHLLSIDDQLACLDCIHGSLEEGGRLILDLFNPSLEMLTEKSYLEEFGHEPPFVLPDGREVLRRHRFVERDLHRQIRVHEVIYYVRSPDGTSRRLTNRYTIRYLFRFEAEHLLARAGFDVEAVCADYDRSPFGSKYPGELIFIAKKI